MFSPQEIITAVKDAAFDQMPPEELSHCQLLEANAKQLGFESYHHLRTWLASTPEELVEDYSLALMRKVCAKRLPTQTCAYYEFMVLPDGGIGYYSYFIGWDKRAEEVRVPRPLHGLPTALGLRNIAKHPIYVIESLKELGAWQWSWHATALVPEALAKSSFPLFFDKDKFVTPNPPLHRTRSTNKYSSNVARG